MCVPASVSRLAGPAITGIGQHRAEATSMRDAIQRLALAYRHYGYRRISAQLRREGFAVNHKRVLRPVREDNLLSCGSGRLCP
ncbi:transposase InsO family protein [Bradyrhizobium sp. USDA 4524]